jgi:hypothetical protein
VKYETVQSKKYNDRLKVMPGGTTASAGRGSPNRFTSSAASERAFGIWMAMSSWISLRSSALTCSRHNDHRYKAHLAAVLNRIAAVTSERWRPRPRR